MKGIFTSRQFRQGSVATAITVVVTALVVLFNYLAVELTGRYGLTLDLTPTKLFSITPETKQYLAGLNKDVVFNVMSPEETFSGYGDYYLQANEVLKKYALESPHISVTYTDLYANPAIAENYPSLQISQYSILVTSGDKTRDVTVSQLYDIQSDEYGQNQRVAASKAEQTLTTAVLAVTSEKSVDVAFITGHNEPSLAEFGNRLAANNYLTGTHDILTQDIPDNYTAAIIIAPQRDYEQEELQRLDRFLKNGGKYGKTLLYFAYVSQPELPNLDAFLADWGIGIGQGAVAETNSALASPNNPYFARLEYGEEEYSASAAAAQLYLWTAESRPLELLFETKSSITTKTLAQFSATSGIATAETKAFADIAVTGPIPALVIASSLAYDGTTPMSSHVVVSGTVNILSESLMSGTNYANSEYLLNLMAKLTGQEAEAVKIQSKAIGSTQLGINGYQQLTLGGIFVILLPLGVLVFGILVWLRRRHK